MAKYETKTKPGAQSVADFIAAVPDPARLEGARQIDAMMRLVSGLKAAPAGSLHHRLRPISLPLRQRPRGRFAAPWFLPRKAELVLYVLGADPEDQAEENDLLGRLGKHRTGKSCLYIRNLDQVDFDVLERLAALSWERMAKRYPA